MATSWSAVLLLLGNGNGKICHLIGYNVSAWCQNPNDHISNALCGNVE